MSLATTAHCACSARLRSRFQRVFPLLLPFLLLGLVPIAGVRAAPPSPAPKASDVRRIDAGAELWVTLDYLEVQTFNEGVHKNPEDQIRRTHDEARQERWKLGEQFESFRYDGKTFAGRWHSPAFKAEYFTEFVMVEGVVAPGGASVPTLILTKVRFDRPSAEPPESHGYSKMVLHFKDLQRASGFGNSVTYRFVPGKSRVVEIAGIGEFLSTQYHSRTTTTWSGLAPFTGKNEVTGQPRDIHASITFHMGGRQAPPPAQAGPRTVRVSGDSKLTAEAIAWLGKRKGVKILDGTARSATAIQQERDLAKAGLLEEGTGPSAQAPQLASDAVLEMHSIGTDPRDASTRAVLRVRDGDTKAVREVELTLDLEMDRYLKLGNAAFGEWVRLRTAQFVEQLQDVLQQNGL